MDDKKNTKQIKIQKYCKDTKILKSSLYYRRLYEII
ncbi:MAG: hypothetical protein Terrestrivirus2_209 [Terrestrivirus sp.]|uniref:Uncharacterized protein n=1 Tax=Terrestrivirus sp. TaxID=2487775 RepID=A0A3G4ZP01_9VIRU|nr:MAG: hypothetical protein Terrestrivirus2_209 [Terrestrivirus sp.]